MSSVSTDYAKIIACGNIGSAHKWLKLTTGAAIAVFKDRFYSVPVGWSKLDMILYCVYILVYALLRRQTNEVFSR